MRWLIGRSCIHSFTKITAPWNKVSKLIIALLFRVLTLDSAHYWQQIPISSSRSPLIAGSHLEPFPSLSCFRVPYGVETRVVFLYLLIPLQSRGLFTLNWERLLDVYLLYSSVFYCIRALRAFAPNNSQQATDKHFIPPRSGQSFRLPLNTRRITTFHLCHLFHVKLNPPPPFPNISPSTHSSSPLHNPHRPASYHSAQYPPPPPELAFPSLHNQHFRHCVTYRLVFPYPAPAGASRSVDCAPLPNAAISTIPRSCFSVLSRFCSSWPFDFTAPPGSFCFPVTISEHVLH